MTDLEIPETGAVFTFGKSRFAENKPSHFFIKNDPVIHVACGDEHTAVICTNGRIFAFGSNEWGQLGLGHNNMVHKPSCVKALKPEKAKFIACGRAHTIILTESNNIYACGSNTDGQLGLENVDMLNTPTKLQHVHLKENGIIKKVSAGSQHTVVLTESGLVFVWGSNSEGQLGIESNRTNCKTPTLLEFKDKIRDVSCGYYHTAVLTETGNLFTFGENENGKLGLPQGDSQIFKPTMVKSPEKFESISCGGRHNIALTKNGEAIGFGSNNYGELGFEKDVSWISEPKLLPTELFGGEMIKYVSCGDNHTAFITENNRIYTCGDTRHGKLCLDDFSEDGHFGPTQIIRFQNYKINTVSCGGCHTIICAQKLSEDEINLLPPLQRIPHSILNSEMIRTEASVEANSLLNGTNELIDSLESQHLINGMLHSNKIASDLKDEVLKNVENTSKNLTDELTDISQIIQTEKEQINEEYDKIILNNKLTEEASNVKENIEDKIEEFKSIKDNIHSDSVDNLLQEIEDNLSNKSGKTFTSDTISVKSNEKNAEPIIIKEPQIEKTTENDEEDLKMEVPVQQNERKFSRIFGTFRKKKASASSTTESKTSDNSENSEEIKTVDEITLQKSEKSKTCTIL